MKAFETVSFHIVKPCNMKCKFCYATFDDMHIQQMKKEDAFIAIEKLISAGVQKITFAGGEPMLYRHIDDCILFAKSLGATTSIVTNGSLLTSSWLLKMKSHLDWIGISIDSLKPETNALIGRTTKSSPLYYRLCSSINNIGYKLKINTVVNKYNHLEDLNYFLNEVQPSRWKVFQTLKVDGQNDKQFADIKCTQKQFNSFIERHSEQTSMVAENNDAMTGSYLLIDPQGRLFENSKGKHTYSDSIINNDFDKCLSQISLDRKMFEKRGGIYQW